MTDIVARAVLVGLVSPGRHQDILSAACEGLPGLVVCHRAHTLCAIIARRKPWAVVLPLDDGRGASTPFLVARINTIDLSTQVVVYYAPLTGIGGRLLAAVRAGRCDLLAASTRPLPEGLRLLDERRRSP